MSMKATKYEAHQDGFRFPCIAGVVERNNGDNHVWALFKRSDIPQEWIDNDGKFIHDYPWEGDTNVFDLALELTGWASYHRGVGRPFGAEPSVQIGRNHVLVKQLRALDV